MPSRPSVPPFPMPPQPPFRQGEGVVLSAGLRRATDFIRDHADERLTLGQIANAAGLPNRTLQKHFRHFLGVSPMTWLRQLRLERTRDDLLRGTDNGNVTRIAGGHGFIHLGRYSAAYRQAFHELPSETARAGPVRTSSSTAPSQPSVAMSLAPEIWRAELARAGAHRPEHPEALALALQALPFASIAEPVSAARALDLAGKAADRDPDYALPLALAAWCHAQRVVYTWTGSAVAERAMVLHLAREAERLDHGDATVQTALCAAYAAIGDLAAAERCIHLALAADPSSPWAWQRSAWLHTYRGDAETAAVQFRHALRLDPAAPQVFNTYIGLGLTAFDIGGYREATGWIRLGLRSSPAALWSHRVLAAAEARQGNKDQARLSTTRLRHAQPDLSIGRIVATLPVNADFLARLADGLETAGMPV